MHSISVTFPSSAGYTLAGTIDLPETKPRAWALFSHCFAGSRFTPAAARTCKWLAEHGIACLRFDYPGLGQSEGDFANSSFSMNVADLKAAAQWLADNYEAPTLLIGHSLGGAVAIKAATDMPSIRAVATMGAPFDPAHSVLHFADKIGEVDETGAVPVTLGGRELTISRSYLEDLADINPEAYIGFMRKPLLILHSPVDQTVGIDSAQKIYLVARYPKSLVSLDRADHLMTREGAAQHAASVIYTWVQTYLPPVEANELPETTAEARSTQSTKMSAVVRSGGRELFTDVPRSDGGKDLDISPLSLMLSALATDTNNAVRAAAAEQRIRTLDDVHVTVSLDGDAITRSVKLVGELSGEERALLAAAVGTGGVEKLLGADIRDEIQ
ncbi:Alpha/beta hydrolase family protein [Corynebacterium kalinowskii]|uniref:Alpha/beta hydrolase family protein n=1 Tax=Corynebacterium kalinowskii TaxID=2675216 RepID=A0A6B8VKE1_9CORY|nr:alpha/beta fold hydrolase [Corynebacterium kalinowskii]QGU01944.1 Alpha/beta hydrolase family protein [Corynebacterium kalinowskii]